MTQNTIYGAVGAVGITSGITVLLSSNETNLMIAASCIIFLGLAMCVIAYMLARNADRKEIAKRLHEIRNAEKIISELKTLNNNIIEFTQELRLGKSHRKNI